MLEPKSFRGYVVLVVDDDRDTLDTTTFLIADLLGCRVMAASSGHEALRLIEDQHVDLVFADVVMPRMDGLTLTHLVRQRFPTMPVVLTTGLPTAVKTAVDRGAVALIKPYLPEQLVAVFSEQLLTRLTTTTTVRARDVPDEEATAANKPGVLADVHVALERLRDVVARAEAIVLKQADILRRLKESQGDSALAEWTLRIFEDSLAEMRLRVAAKEREAASRQALARKLTSGAEPAEQ